MAKSQIVSNIAIAILGLSGIAFALHCQPVHAGNAVTPNLLLLKDRCLSQRNQFLSAKAQQVRCWKDDEAALKTINNSLIVPAHSHQHIDRQALLAEQARRQKCISVHKQAVGLMDKTVVDIDRDIAWADSKLLTHYGHR